MPNKEKTAVRDSYASNVEQFLNRIMVLHVEKLQRHFRPVLRALPEGGEGGQATRGVRLRSSKPALPVEEIRARNQRSVAKAEMLFVDPASGARTKLHELEGEADAVRNAFAAAAGTGDQGFYRNRRSRRIWAASGQQAGSDRHWDAHWPKFWAGTMNHEPHGPHSGPYGTLGGRLRFGASEDMPTRTRAWHPAPRTRHPASDTPRRVELG